MALLELLKNDPNFFYYSGQGNFTQKSLDSNIPDSSNGTSQTPLIQFPLPENAGPNTLNYYNLNKFGVDYPQRGGNTSNISIVGPTVPEAAVIDRRRIEKFLRTTRGTIFLQKQKDLQFANPKTQVGTALQSFADQPTTLNFGAVEYTRVYNDGRNTLAQIGVMGSGFHYDRMGNVPVNPFQLSYFYNVKNLGNTNNNRLVNLYKGKISNNVINLVDFNSLRLGISSDPNILLEYPGGPDSVGGRGFTTIERLYYSDQSDIDVSKGDVNAGIFTFNYNELSSIKKLGTDSRGQDVNSKIRQDFRRIFNGQIPSSNYLTDSIPVRLGFDTNTGDPINIASLKIIENDPWTGFNGNAAVAEKDLVKFGIEAVNYNDTTTSIFMQFRAYFTSFNDNNQANYNSVKYVGRGEPFYVYDGFTREISFGFIVAAMSRDELLPMYDKLNTLVSQLYPDYSPSSFMRSPLIKLTIGDYLYRQPGFLRFVNINLERDYPWEVGLDNTYQLPHVLSLDCSFIPVHDFLPRRTTGVGNNEITPLINKRKYDDYSGLAQSRIDILNPDNAPEVPEINEEI